MLEQESRLALAYDYPGAGEEPSLLNILKVILRHRRLIGWVVASGTLAAVIASLLLPNVYTAQATLMPVEKSQAATGLALGLGLGGGGMGLLAARAGFSGREPEDRLAVILQTRAIAEAVIAQQKLLPYLFPGREDEARQQSNQPWYAFWARTGDKPSRQAALAELYKHVAFVPDHKTGVLIISATLEDPGVAARIANAFVAELGVYLQHNALTSAKRHRLFIEGQVATTKAQLASNETALKDFQQRHDLVALGPQTEATVRTYAEVKAKLIAAEVDLGVAAKSYLESDPRVNARRQTVLELQRQLDQLAGGESSGPIISTRQAPGLGLTYMRLTREVMISEKLFELLTQQLASARIEEAQDDISFQVLDSALPPERKTGPMRSRNVLLALLASLVLGVGLAFTAEYWVEHRDDIAQLLKEAQ